jgi:hypothetical protein
MTAISRCEMSLNLIDIFVCVGNVKTSRLNGYEQDFSNFEPIPETQLLKRKKCQKKLLLKFFRVQRVLI